MTIYVKLKFHSIMRKSKNYWTFNTCKVEAIKYSKRSDFKKYSGGAYNYANNKLKCLDIICAHMIPIGNRFKRLVYTYIFSDNSVYIGLTQNISERNEKHKRDIDSAVYKHMKKTNLIPSLTYTDYMDVVDAIKLEAETVLKYRVNGFNILNIAKAGAVGGENIIWTFEKCQQEALKYSSKVEFIRNNNSAYNACRRYKWLNEVCSHMLRLKNSKPMGYWTKDKCKKVAFKFKMRNKFYKKYPGAYMACLKNKWLDDVCKHMNTIIKKPNGYWTKERCAEEALKYNIITTFHKNSGGAHWAAHIKGWLKEICIHMKKRPYKKS